MSHSGFSHFHDGNKYMVLDDGRIAYRTDRRNWAQVVMHGLALDDMYNSELLPRPLRIQSTPRKPTENPPHDLRELWREFEQLDERDYYPVPVMSDHCHCDECQCELDAECSVTLKRGMLLCEFCEKYEVCDMCGHTCDETVDVYDPTLHLELHICGECSYSWDTECCRECGQPCGGYMCEYCRWDARY